jgi:hypothetical protein
VCVRESTLYYVHLILSHHLLFTTAGTTRHLDDLGCDVFRAPEDVGLGHLLRGYLVYLCVCVCVCVCACVRVECVCACVRVYIHAHTQMCTI